VAVVVVEALGEFAHVVDEVLGVGRRAEDERVVAGVVGLALVEPEPAEPAHGVVDFLEIAGDVRATTGATRRVVFAGSTAGATRRAVFAGSTAGATRRAIVVAIRFVITSLVARRMISVGGALAVGVVALARAAGVDVPAAVGVAGGVPVGRRRVG
jgi:hypothetical protein